MSLLKRLETDILIGDGAMGTLLYEQGIDRCFEELNVIDAEKIFAVHTAYLQAGANVIQTNTYAANRIKLENHGLETRVKELNVAACQIAKRAVQENGYVVGTIGGMRNFKLKELTDAEWEAAFLEQVDALLGEDVDGLLLETFYDFAEIQEAVTLIKKRTSLPLIAQVSLGDVGVLQDGTSLSNALQRLEDLGADVVGLNCRMGPFHMARSLEEVPLLDKAFLSVYPNASLPDYRDGRFFYQSNPAYFAEKALEFREAGARLIGGCCGTTPAHIQAVSDALKGFTPVTEKTVKQEPIREAVQVKENRTQTLSEIVQARRSVIVELDPPKELAVDGYMKAAEALHEANVDAITLADNSLASPRVDNMALGSMIKERIGATPLTHITCRDRNLIGLQSHLMGLHALGLNEVLAITGDPTKVGDFPGATSVYDLTSFELIRLIKQLNEGISFSGKTLAEKASFSVAAAFNPNVRALDRAVLRMEKKIESGADYFMTQPVYDVQKIEEIYHETKHISKPIYLGIMPLTSGRNAEFLHNEVPGIKLTDQVRATMAACGNDREKAEREGIAIAKELLDTAMEYFNGIYLITPFLRYNMTVELTKYIHEKDRATLLL